MKLTVLVPSEDYHSSAGARIRYGRLALGLSAQGINLGLQSILDFNPATGDYDALLISKCHDARSLIAAAIASSRGKLVGVDLFDDYFSQTSDSRLVRYREWLAGLLKDCSFCLCSTNMMAEVVQRYRPGLPTHVVNDPAREHDAVEALRLVGAKMKHAHRRQVISVAWFGVGDNPYFSVGLTDLFAHSYALSELRLTGMAVELTVVTNRRALRPEQLELMSRLPLPVTLMEWKEDVERDVLEKSLVAFIPVAAQHFSAAKSLNRAITALSYGCQVLSVGHSLYSALDPLIYRDPGFLLSDLGRRSLRHSEANGAIYREKLKNLASADTEASRLGLFLSSVTPPAKSDVPRLCVVHGLSTRAEIHHLTQSLGGLSIASPYCTANLDFDVFFRGFAPEMTMSVSPRVSDKVAASLKKTSGKAGRSIASLLEANSVAGVAKKGTGPLPYLLATYPASMGAIERHLREVFGSIRLIISETSRVPVSGSVES